MKIYMEVTDDKYELPIAVADSAVELAQIINVSANSIYSSISHAKSKGYKSRYVCVDVEDDEAI